MRWMLLPVLLGITLLGSVTLVLAVEDGNANKVQFVFDSVDSILSENGKHLNDKADQSVREDDSHRAIPLRKAKETGSHSARNEHWGGPAYLTYSAFKQRVLAGQKVNIWLMGDSIGMGYYASVDINPIIIPHVGPNSKYLEASREIQFGFGAYVDLLRAYLNEKNTGSVVRNESAGGWGAPHHLGYLTTPYGGEDTVAEVVAHNQTQPVDAVLIALGVNDADQGIDLPYFKYCMDTIIKRLLAAGILPIVVLENDIKETASSSKYFNYVSALALSVLEFNSLRPDSVGFIDLYNPTHAEIMNHGGYDADTAGGVETAILHDVLHPWAQGHLLTFNTIVASLESSDPVAQKINSHIFSASTQEEEDALFESGRAIVFRTDQKKIKFPLANGNFSIDFSDVGVRNYPIALADGDRISSDSLGTLTAIKGASVSDQFSRLAANKLRFFMGANNTSGTNTNLVISEPLSGSFSEKEFVITPASWGNTVWPVLYIYSPDATTLNNAVKEYDPFYDPALRLYLYVKNATETVLYVGFGKGPNLYSLQMDGNFDSSGAGHGLPYMRYSFARTESDFLIKVKDASGVTQITATIPIADLYRGADDTIFALGLVSQNLHSISDVTVEMVAPTDNNGRSNWFGFWQSQQKRQKSGIIQDVNHAPRMKRP